MRRFLLKFYQWYHKQLNAFALQNLQGKGSNVRFRSNVKCLNPENISIGSNVDVAEYAVLMGRGGITIGDNVVIGNSSIIATVNHVLDDQREFYDRTTSKSISIGDHVWIGAGVIVLPGVTIGSHAVIGAGAVVTKDVPDGTTYVGVPARPI